MTGATFEVLDGGLFTTVQDGGRAEWTHIGVPESGAADPWSLAVANLLAGNGARAAALEITLAGPALLARAPLTIGLAGADLGARIRGGRRLVPGRSHRIAPGDVVELPGDDPSPTAGARAYLALPGGVDVPVVLGSRSTCLSGGFGGHEGRALRTGDVVGAAALPEAIMAIPPELVWPEDRFEPEGGPTASVLRVLPVNRTPDGPAALAAGSWQVGAASDRIGVRLDGDALPPGISGETTTHGVPWGAIQIPADGRPIVLGADHQTTGGYRVVGVVCTADRPVLGQLRPGQEVRFEAIDRRQAVEALRVQRVALAAGAAALRDAAAWDVLVDTAGG